MNASELKRRGNNGENYWVHAHLLGVQSKEGRAGRHVQPPPEVMEVRWLFWQYYEMEYGRFV
jgi:hypothetical protein